MTAREDGGGRDERLMPYRHLAMHVLARALRDLSNPAASPTDRGSAQRFLTGSPMLFHWCRVAALDPRLVAAHAARLAAVGATRLDEPGLSVRPAVPGLCRRPSTSGEVP